MSGRVADFVLLYEVQSKDITVPGSGSWLAWLRDIPFGYDNPKQSGRI